MFNVRDPNVYSIEGFHKNVEVSWMVGNFCVYKCSYCPVFFHSGSVPYHSIDLILPMFNKLPENSIVTLLGGEPTYHPDFERIVLEKPSHIRISMVSNGAKPLAFWQSMAPHMNIVAFTFHPEFANVDRFIENALEVSKHVKDFRSFLMIMPDKWDYCVEVYNKLTDAGLTVLPKLIFEGFGSNLDPKYTEEQLAWVAARNKTTFKSITIYDKDRNVLHKTNPNELIATGQNDFTGFKCAAPQKHVSIELDQKFYNAKCSQKVIYGNLASGEFKLPEEPMICRTPFCKCQSDLTADKFK